jgi:hypothetical protein
MPFPKLFSLHFEALISGESGLQGVSKLANSEFRAWEGPSGARKYILRKKNSLIRKHYSSYVDVPFLRKITKI